MVLGMVTGSMPMLFSLLLMQGITLTMWRSFLDKAIPRYNGVPNWRKNIEQAITSTSNMAVPSANTGETAASIQIPTSIQSPSLEQVSSPLSPDSVAQSLQILSKLDPTVIQLLNQLNSKSNGPSIGVNSHAVPQHNLLNSPMDVMGNPTGLGMSNAAGIYANSDLTTSPPQYASQYSANLDQNHMKYMEVSSDGLSQPNYGNAQQQYIYEQYPQSPYAQHDTIDPNNYYQAQSGASEDGKVQYEYVVEANQDATTTVASVDEDSTEEVEKEQASPEQEEVKEVEPDDDKEAAEDRRNMPQVIIGPPINGPHRQRERKKQHLQESASKFNVARTKKAKRMFGKPRVITKRMLSLEPITRKFKKTKRLISSRILRPSHRTLSTTQRPQSWKLIRNGPYRFATPRYPIPLLDPIISNRHSLHQAGSEKVHKFESRSSVDPKADHVSVVVANRTRKLKLKSKKIRLVEIEEIKPNCSLPERTRKGKFTVLWSQKVGWPQSNSTNCTSNGTEETVQISLSSGIPSRQNDSNEAVTSTSTINSVTQVSSTEPDVTTSLPQATVITEISNPVSTSKTIITSTTIASSSSTVPDMSIPKSFIDNFNQFLSSLTTSAPVRTSTTTTTTPSPITTSTSTESIVETGSADQLPKEFLYHVLMAINASKIDDYQIDSANKWTNSGRNVKESIDLSNSVSNPINTKQTQPEVEAEVGDDEDEDDDNQVDSTNEEDSDNRIDGKNIGRHRFKRICYYLLDGGKDGQLDIGQLELHICSHLIVGYARISTNGLVVAQKPLEDSEKYRRLTLMKLQHPRLKILLSVGDLGGTSFSIVASNNRTRERFIESILDFCDEFNFDGVDIDWEFPSFRTGNKEDKSNFILLLSELRSRSNKIFNRRQNKANSAKSKFIISVAVGAPLIIASTSYIIPSIAKVVDFVNLMSYDFHYYRADRPYTGHHAPLYPRSADKAYYSTLNVAWTATYWANNGMPLKKIIIGVPTYARTYNLVVPVGQSVINAPANGPGIGRGKINYSEVCQFLKMPGSMKQFDIYSQVPYAYRNYDWIAYENEMSVAIKAQWAIKTGMGGIVTFALNFDDFKGKCRDDGKKFPLQKTISNLLELASIKSYKKSSYVMKIRY